MRALAGRRGPCAAASLPFLALSPPPLRGVYTHMFMGRAPRRVVRGGTGKGGGRSAHGRPATVETRHALSPVVSGSGAWGAPCREWQAPRRGESDARTHTYTHTNTRARAQEEESDTRAHEKEDGAEWTATTTTIPPINSDDLSSLVAQFTMGIDDEKNAAAAAAAADLVDEIEAAKDGDVDEDQEEEDKGLSVPELLDEAKRNFALRKWDVAVDAYGQLLESL